MYQDLITPYQTGKSPSLMLGGIIINNQVLPESPVHLVLKSLNRHGLISGATGSGKTKTIQVLSEQLSLAGVPSLVMDIKGDASGLAMPGENNAFLQARSESLQINFTPRSFPVEFLTLIESHAGVPLRTTIEAFGPILFARMLDLSEAQEGGLTVLFEFAKEEKLPLISLADVRAVLQFLQTPEGKEKIERRFGTVSSASLGIIIRKIIELESQGAGAFFGEPSFNIMDLIKTNDQDLGIISILRLMDMQEKPQLFATFMLKLLSDLYAKLPEAGDLEKPKLVLFFDEAHLIFADASKALLQLMNTIIKLIRSKGISILFCTQSPDDIPENVLSQLGLKIQHALRAFTAKDRKALKLVAQNFPVSKYYQTEQLLTELGIGEALVSALDENGKPTPLIQCKIRAPESRMGVITNQELNNIISTSTLYPRYRQKEDKISAKDILSQQINANEQSELPSTTPAKNESSVPSIVTAVTKNTLFRQIIRQLVRDVFRALFGNKKR